MRLIATSIAALALLTPTVLGDFSIYAAGIGGNGISGNVDGWQVYPKTSGVIPCKQALEWIWRSSKDVSGGKYGVRCKGDGKSCVRSGSGDGIKELELNTRQKSNDNTRPHFTFYANRGGAIVDLSGKKIGTCKPAPEQNFYCGIKAGRAEGTRKLDFTSSLTAKDFKQPV